MARSIPLSFPWGADVSPKAQSESPAATRGAEVEASKPLAGMLLAAVMSALLVVADQLIETWAHGHLLLVWVALWTVAFAALALLAPPLRQLANGLAQRVARGAQSRALQRADEALSRYAQTDARVMHDIQVATTRSHSGD